MARTGLSNYRYSVANVDPTTGAVTYTGAKTPGKATTFSAAINKADASLWADDGLDEYDNTVTGGDVTAGIDREDLETMAELLGHDIDAETGEVTDSADDVAPYVGFGKVVRLLESNVQKFRAVIYTLVKFSEPDESDTTGGETIEFGTYELPGKIVIPKDRDWRKRKTFASLADAVSYLETYFAAPTQGTQTPAQGETPAAGETTGTSNP